MASRICGYTSPTSKLVSSTALPSFIFLVMGDRKLERLDKESHEKAQGM